MCVCARAWWWWWWWCSMYQGKVASPPRPPPSASKTAEGVAGGNREPVAPDPTTGSPLLDEGGRGESDRDCNREHVSCLDALGDVAAAALVHTEAAYEVVLVEIARTGAHLAREARTVGSLIAKGLGLLVATVACLVTMPRAV